MKARDIVGKTVKAVRQVRRDDAAGGRATEVKEIEFTDGSLIYFSVAEQVDGGDYIVQAFYHKPHAGGAR